MQPALLNAVETGAAGGQLFAGLSELAAGIVAQNGCRQLGQIMLAAAQVARRLRFQAEAEFVQALGQAMEKCIDASFGAADRQAGKPLAGLQQLVARGAVEPVRLLGQPFGDLVLRLCNQFGGSGRRGSAQVGNKIGDGEVGLVANRGDHRQSRSRDRTGDALAVEGCQIFQRSATTGQDDQSTRPSALSSASAASISAGAESPCTLTGQSEDTQAGVAAGNDVEKVTNHRAGGRSDNAHGVRKAGQRAFAFGVEEAFGLEAGLELFKGQLQRTRADRLHGFGHQLHLTALFINADPAADEHVQAILDAKAQQHRLTAEEHHGQLRISVLQREVDMAARRGTEVGDFTLDPDVAVLQLDQLAHLAHQLAHRPDAARWARLLKVEAELRAEAMQRREWVMPDHHLKV